MAYKIAVLSITPHALARDIKVSSRGGFDLSLLSEIYDRADVPRFEFRLMASEIM